MKLLANHERRYIGSKDEAYKSVKSVAEFWKGEVRVWKETREHDWLVEPKRVIRNHGKTHCWNAGKT